jgi:hypothetical protein
MIGVSLKVFVRDDPHVDDLRTLTGGFGGGPGSKYSRLPGSTTRSPLLEISCLVDRRFSLQKIKTRIPRTSVPNGIPMASPTVVAMGIGFDDVVTVFFAVDDALLAEDSDEDITFAFFRLRTS